MKGCFIIKSKIKYLIYFGTISILLGVSFLLPSYTDFGFYSMQIMLFIWIASVVTGIIYYIYQRVTRRFKEDFIDVEFLMIKIFTLIILVAALSLTSYLQLRFIDLNLTPPLISNIYMDDYGNYIHQTPYRLIEPTPIKVTEKSNNLLIMDFSYQSNDSENMWYSIVHVKLTYDINHYLTSYTSEIATNYNNTSYQSLKVQLTYTYALQTITESSTQYMVIQENKVFENYKDISLYDFSDEDIIKKEIINVNFQTSDHQTTFNLTNTKIFPDAVDTHILSEGYINQVNFHVNDNEENLYIYNDSTQAINSIAYTYYHVNQLWLTDTRDGDDIKTTEQFIYDPMTFLTAYIYQTDYGYLYQLYSANDGVINDELETNDDEINGYYRDVYFNNDHQVYYVITIPDFQNMISRQFIGSLYVVTARPTLTFKPLFKYLIETETLFDQA